MFFVKSLITAPKLVQRCRKDTQEQKRVTQERKGVTHILTKILQNTFPHWNDCKFSDWKIVIFALMRNKIEDINSQSFWEHLYQCVLECLIYILSECASVLNKVSLGITLLTGLNLFYIYILVLNIVLMLKLFYFCFCQQKS